MAFLLFFLIIRTHHNITHHTFNLIFLFFSYSINVIPLQTRIHSIGIIIFFFLILLSYVLFYAQPMFIYVILSFRLLFNQVLYTLFGLLFQFYVISLSMISVIL